MVVGENADPWAAIGNQGALIKEAMEPVKLDPSLDHAIVMVSGPDRPGLIPMVSEAIHARCHGTISESKMVKLGGQFMMMLVRVCAQWPCAGKGSGGGGAVSPPDYPFAAPACPPARPANRLPLAGAVRSPAQWRRPHAWGAHGAPPPLLLLHSPP